MQLRDRDRGAAVVRLAHIVDRVPVVVAGGPTRHHLGELVDDLLRFAVLEQLVEVRVAVQVVEILQQAELVVVRVG
ncbi:MAG: hypothetical protein ACT4NY_28305 [Pseudonocardiales bacterium]